MSDVKGVAAAVGPVYYQTAKNSSVYIKVGREVWRNESIEKVYL